MNKQERAKAIRELCEDLQKEMLAVNDRIPDSWDGVELQQLLADTASKGTPVGSMEDKRGKRRRDYEEKKARYRLC